MTIADHHPHRRQHRHYHYPTNPSSLIIIIHHSSSSVCRYDYDVEDDEAVAISLSPAVHGCQEEPEEQEERLPVRYLPPRFAHFGE